MTPLLQTRELTVGYRKRRATSAILREINVTAERGELICLLGLNGIGKSTLMRTLADAQPAISGVVEINGTDISHMSHYELARHIGIVLTERVLVGAMPAFRLVELGRYPHTGWSGTLSDSDRTIVHDAITAVGASHFAHRDIGELSDGERQRIMIARALAQRPSVLLLDEPAAFLDVSARVEMIAMLRKLAREQQVAVILSSHDLELSLRTADTIWLLDKDSNMHIGAPEDLLTDGSVAAVFSSQTIAFNAKKRTFTIRNGTRGRAFVQGSPDNAGMAITVLEREGFEVTTIEEGASVIVRIGDQGWTAQNKNTHGQGTTFAELAHFVRQTPNSPAIWTSEKVQ